MTKRHDLGILTGLLCTRTNMKVYAALAFLVDAFRLGIMSADAAFTVCLHEHHYSIPEYN